MIAETRTIKSLLKQTSCAYKTNDECMYRQATESQMSGKMIILFDASSKYVKRQFSG